MVAAWDGGGPGTLPSTPTAPDCVVSAAAIAAEPKTTAAAVSKTRLAVVTNLPISATRSFLFL
jgi:hypothetical protein